MEKGKSSFLFIFIHQKSHIFIECPSLCVEFGKIKFQTVILVLLCMNMQMQEELPTNEERICNTEKET